MVANRVGYFGFKTFANLLRVSYSASEKLVSIVKDMQKFSVLRIVKFFLESQFRKIWSRNKSFIINLRKFSLWKKSRLQAQKISIGKQSFGFEFGQSFGLVTQWFPNNQYLGTPWRTGPSWQPGPPGPPGPTGPFGPPGPPWPIEPLWQVTTPTDQTIKKNAEFVYLVLLLVGFRDMIFHTYFFRPGGWRDDDTGGRDLASSERKLKDRVSALQVTLVLVLGVGVAI